MMHKQLLTIANLFHQLGLDNQPEAIESFLKQHSLKQREKLEEATFWSSSQKDFIKEGRGLDADWCEAIDELDVLLRH